MGQFADDVLRWVDKVEARIDTTMRAASLQAMTSIVQATPVDTGRAKGNWQITFDEPAQEQLDNMDPTGVQVLADAQSKLDTAGNITTRTIWITNALDYIIPLEQGSSTQGSHMVTRVIDAWDQIVDQAAALAKEVHP